MRIFILLSVCAFVTGVLAAEKDYIKFISVKEGESVTLDTGVINNPNDVMKWYYNGILITEITDQCKICTGDQCKERFRDRLNVNHDTGSLTITNTRVTDTGLYELQINNCIRKRFNVTRVFAHERVIVSMMEGDSVTLHTGVQTNQQDRIRWYYNDIRIAQINGDQTKICTDVQCKLRFRDRLKLDHQTGSLTIMNTRNTGFGVFKLEIISGDNTDIVYYAFLDTDLFGFHKGSRNSLKEGDSVVLQTMLNLNDVATWYFNDILIAEITGDLSVICTDVQCNNDTERFRDRLKLDHDTGCLTIMNTRITDSGEYTLKINNSRFSLFSIFSVSVTAVPEPGVSPVSVAGIFGGVFFVAVCLCGCCKCLKDTRMQRNDQYYVP